MTSRGGQRERGGWVADGAELRCGIGELLAVVLAG
jgi:hypothetical protein